MHRGLLQLGNAVPTDMNSDATHNEPEHPGSTGTLVPLRLFHACCKRNVNASRVNGAAQLRNSLHSAQRRSTHRIGCEPRSVAGTSAAVPRGAVRTRGQPSAGT